MLKTLVYFVNLVVHEYGGVGFPGHARVCQRLSPAKGEAGGEGLDCVSSPPFMFIIPQGPLVTMVTQLTGCQVQNNIFPSKKFCWHHPSWGESNEGLLVLAGACAGLKAREPSCHCFSHVYLSNGVKAKIEPSLLTDQRDNLGHHLLSELSLSFGGLTNWDPLLAQLFTVWPWAGNLTSLCFSFLIGKTGRAQYPSNGSYEDCTGWCMRRLIAQCPAHRRLAVNCASWLLLSARALPILRLCLLWVFCQEHPSCQASNPYRWKTHSIFS